MLSERQNENITVKKLKLNQFTNFTYPLMLLLLLWCDIVATSVDNSYTLIKLQIKNNKTKGYQRINRTENRGDSKHKKCIQYINRT